MPYYAIPCHIIHCYTAIASAITAIPELLLQRQLLLLLLLLLLLVLLLLLQLLLRLLLLLPLLPPLLLLLLLLSLAIVPDHQNPKSCEYSEFSTARSCRGSTINSINVRARFRVQVFKQCMLYMNTIAVMKACLALGV